MTRDETGLHRAAPATYKVIILGESNVGKSSLFLRYTEARFKEAIANTIGVNNSNKELVIDGNPVVLQMWDTAGQERFRSIVSVFYREADGFILAYDVTSRRSFDYMRQMIVELQDWIVPEFTVLVGNKADCIDDADQLREETEILERLAAAHGFRYYISSAKTGHNVNEIFEELARQMYYNKKKAVRAAGGLDLRKRKRKKGRWCYR